MRVAVVALGAVSRDTGGRTYLAELLGPLGDNPGLDVEVHVADPEFAVPSSCRAIRHDYAVPPERARRIAAEAWLASRLGRADVLLAPFNYLPATWRGPSVVVHHNTFALEAAGTADA